jgi:hypothetical protein
MSNLSIVLFESIALPDSNNAPLVLPKISNKAKGAGYHGNTNPMHTVIYSFTNNWVGIIKLQATLVTQPQESDWVDVKNTTIGDGINIVPNGAISINFNGNFVWVRAIIVNFSAGQINRVQYTHN